MADKANRAAIADVLAHVRDYATRDDLITALDQAARVGDPGTRYVVIVRDPAFTDYTVFGPYASAETAEKAIRTGALAASEGARGAIYAMHPAVFGKRGRKVANPDQPVLTAG